MAQEPDPLRPIDEDVDPQALAAVQEALAGLAFLRPDDATSDPMPDWAWERIAGALAVEAAASTPPRRTSRVTRWAGGLVAASVAVLAVGVAVTAFQGNGDGGAVVADGSARDGAASTMAVAEPLAESFAAPASPVPDARLAAGPEQLTFAGMVPPVLRLVDSDTDYTSAGLGGQVERVLARFGMAPASMETEDLIEAPMAVAMPDTEAEGFLSSAERLRDCITRLTEAADSTALLVDMATFEGQAAGVVVAPEYPVASEPQLTELEVWVVDPECERPMRAIRIEVTGSR